MATQILGKVGIVLKGEYNNATTYQKLDAVTYNGQGYVSKQETTGNLPTNTEYWQLIAEKGYTPVKGTDYFTTEEKLEMETDVKTKVITDITPTLNNNLQTAKDYTDNQNANDIKNVSYNSTTGVLTFTKHDNTTITVDLPVEDIVDSGYYDSLTQDLVLVLESGQEIRIPASGLIDDYTGTTSATIQVVVSNDNKITCNIVSGSISKTLLTTALQNEINAKANASDVYSKTDSDNRYLQNSKIVILTQAEYDALQTKDATVYYLIKEV